MTDSSPVLASAPGDCCLKGFVHLGEPKGDIIKIAGLDTYRARPESLSDENRIVMYFPDVWGINGSFQFNGKLLMDYFASQGFLVLGVDYFQGHRDDTTTDPGFDYEAWKAKHMAFAIEHVPIWMDAVVKEYGREDTKYAVVGYCFGAPFVMNALAGSLASVGAFGHPAFLNESHFEKCAKPLFLSCAETDHTFPEAARHRAEEILKTNKRVYHFQLFSGVEHGFALRGNMDEPYERWVKEESAAGIVRWFKFFLK
ncbi:dienelactone hydrolase [Moniliophthora roreri MCA 2997]|uniref:Dienelactone hydrolase n=1 Tax=Moniliophthora roreri (strain MCA 2997) TaxID=1381753 RepID=V2YQW9_MONRO|nr:dienelactone hydrolase [Moniliophthora roreri MCA 2997]